MSKVFEYYIQVGGAFGPSGREDGVREVIGALAGDFCDDIQTDALGNLICRKKGTAQDKKKILFAAHMDSIGIVATCIDEKGFIRFSQVGGLSWSDLINIPVRFANGIRGVISFEEKTPWREMSLSHLFLDIGAKDKKEAESMVCVGDFAVFEATPFIQNGVLVGPYLDNRIGCVALLLAMEQLPETVENDLYFRCRKKSACAAQARQHLPFSPILALQSMSPIPATCPNKNTQWLVTWVRGRRLRLWIRRSFAVRKLQPSWMRWRSSSA